MKHVCNLSSNIFVDSVVIMIIFSVTLHSNIMRIHSNRVCILHFYALYVKFKKTAGFISVDKILLEETRTDLSKVLIHFKTHLIFIWNFIH